MEDKKTNKKVNKSLVIIIAAALISLGIGFFGGVQYQKSKRANVALDNFRPSNTSVSGTTQGKTGKTLGQNGNQPVSGQITSVDSGSITIKTQDGGSKIITLSSSTKIKITSDGTVSNLAKGDTVVVNGTTNSDGTVSAITITIGGELMQLGENGPQGQAPQGN